MKSPKSALSSTAIRNFLTRSTSTKQKSILRNHKPSSENAPPPNPNIPISDVEYLAPKLEKERSRGFVESVAPEASSDDMIEKEDDTLHRKSRVEPSFDGSVKKEDDTLHRKSRVEPSFDGSVKKEDGAPQKQCVVEQSSDAAVKVVVRIKPESGHEGCGKGDNKGLSDTLFFGDREFTFDSVLGSNSTQEDVFQMVGIPLVKNAMTGYNTTVLSYGQSGSGKTYTMWGPPSSMVEESSHSQQGLVPRIFQMLFSEIELEQEKCEGREINYQCRCSFLEIHNDQIGDLLDPTQRNLQIRDDQRNGLYVENLTEEYVCSYEEVAQMLIKGLSNRKVGATSVNSRSSRSHIIFTCIIESWRKGSTSKCFSSTRTSRISLVDLAGLDRNKTDDAGKPCLREAKSVKKSLSHLGSLVNGLAKRRQTGDGDVSYEGSSLTHVLRESFGGNAKLVVVCAVSPDTKNESETLSTLRFGQRVKYLQNEPVVNEITEDDVNGLSDQIRQLKEELIKAKSSVHNTIGNHRYFYGPNARDSLNHLRVSLNRSLLLPRADRDIEEEINLDANDVKELCKQLDELTDCEDKVVESSQKGNLTRCSTIGESCGTESSEDYTNCPEEFELEESNNSQDHHELAPEESLTSSEMFVTCQDTSLSISSSRCSQILEEPTLTESPKFGRSPRRSVTVSSKMLASGRDATDGENFTPDGVRKSLRQSLQSSRLSGGPAESLAASLQRGLEIIESHERKKLLNKSTVSFSFEHLTLKSSPEVDKANASSQMLSEEKQSIDGRLVSYICTSCQRRRSNIGSDETQDNLKSWIVSSEVGKEVENDSEASKRMKELEILCQEQAAKIELLEQQSTMAKTERLSSCIPHKEETRCELEKVLQIVRVGESEENLAEEKCEVKEVREERQDQELGSFSEMNEKEALFREIQMLRGKLQSYESAVVPDRSTDKMRLSLLSRSMQIRKSCLGLSHPNEEELERERERWLEMESEWISLTDELRIDIETHRQHAEKLEKELRSEKNCTEELEDVVHRSVLNHARMIEHYSELQEKHNDLVERHRAIMEWIAEVKKAAAKAGSKGKGARSAKLLAAELSAASVERERERKRLRKENERLKAQLRDTAEAVHAAGELLVRLREAEQATSAAEENLATVQEDNEKLRKQIEKLKKKHKSEMSAVRQYLAESKLPQSALQQTYYAEEDPDIGHGAGSHVDEDQAWRAEFGAIYQDHY